MKHTALFDSQSSFEAALQSAIAGAISASTGWSLGIGMAVVIVVSIGVGIWALASGMRPAVSTKAGAALGIIALAFVLSMVGGMTFVAFLAAPDDISGAGETLMGLLLILGVGVVALSLAFMLVGAVVGIAALRDIASSPEHKPGGTGLAIASIILAVVLLVQAGVGGPAAVLLLVNRVETGPAVEPFTSDVFGYSITPEGDGWYVWDTLAQDYPEAEYGALLGGTVGGVVVAVALPEGPIDIDTFGQAAVADVGGDWDALDSSRPITRGNLQGKRVRFTGQLDGYTYQYEGDVLLGDGVGYLVFSWSADRSTDHLVLSFIDAFQPGEPSLPAENRNAYLTARFADDVSGRILRANIATWNSIGVEYYLQRRYSDAIAFFKAAAAYKGQPSTHTNLVATINVQGNLDEALSAAERGLAMHPDSGELKSWAAFLHAELGNDDKALPLMEELFAGNYVDDETFSSYVVILLGQERNDEALDVARKYVKASNSIEAIEIYSTLLQIEEAYDEGIEYLAAMLERRPNNRDLLLMLAEHYTSAERYDEAIEILDKQLVANPDDGEVHMQRGSVMLGLEKYAEAKRAYEKAGELLPGDTEIDYLIRMTSAMLGEGDNTIVREEVEAVALPEAVQQQFDQPLSPALAADASAVTIAKALAIHFVPGEDYRETTYEKLAILDAQAVDSYSTMVFEFDPVSEQVYLNDLKVFDEDGNVVFEGDVNKSYVMDADEGEIRSHQKVLNIPVGGLRKGAVVELTFTRRHLGSSERFVLTEHMPAAATPVQYDALVLTGAIDQVHFVELNGIETRQVGDALVWDSRDLKPVVYEPIGASFWRYQPIVVLAPTGDSWEQTADAYLEQIETMLQADDETAALAKRVAGDAADRESRIAAVVGYIQRELTYQAIEFGRRGRIPAPAAKTARDKLGDCKDHALLAYHMLRALDIDARLALIKLSGQVVPGAPSLDQFDHMVVYAPQLQGDGLWLDTTEKNLNLFRSGKLWLADKHALVLDEKQSKLMHITPGSADENSLQSNRTIELADNGVMTVSETVRATGSIASVLRQYLKAFELSQRKDAVGRWLKYEGASVTVSSVELESIDAPDEPLVMTIGYSLRNLARPAGDQIVGRLPPIWQRHWLEPDFVEKRQTPFEIIEPATFDATTELVFGSKLTLKHGPSSWQAADEFAVANGQVQNLGDRLRVQTSIKVTPGFHSAAKYDAFYESRHQILTKLTPSVVLERAAD